MRIFAIDPGVHSGIALFDDEALVAHDVVKDRLGAKEKHRFGKFAHVLHGTCVEWAKDHGAADLIVCEAFQSFGQHKNKANERTANVNGQFAGLVMGVACALHKPQFGIIQINNMTWTKGKTKAQRAPAVCFAHKLSFETDSNEIDAVALGAWASRRGDELIKGL